MGCKVVTFTVSWGSQFWAYRSYDDEDDRQEPGNDGIGHRVKPTEVPPSPQEAERLHRQLYECLRENRATSNYFCSHLEAVVHLDTGDAKPSFIRQYKVPQVLTAHVDEWLEKMLASGVVGPAPVGCQWNSPIVVVKKKDAQGNLTGVRICIDPRPLNKMLKDDNHPLPLISGVCCSGELRGFYVAGPGTGVLSVPNCRGR